MTLHRDPEVSKPMQTSARIAAEGVEQLTSFSFGGCFYRIRHVCYLFVLDIISNFFLVRLNRVEKGKNEECCHPFIPCSSKDHYVYAALLKPAQLVATR